MGDSYTGFAALYDSFMENIPYDQWTAAIIDILKVHGISDGIVLDLGCGTGVMTRKLAQAGYDMIGVDLSYDMLQEAQLKEAEDSLGILYLCQDMREFELYGTVRACICACDSINYLTSIQDLVTCFKLVNNYLDPSGLFIFDFNTVHKYRDIIGDSVIAENKDDASFIWENFYDEDEHINEYDITFFEKVSDDEEGELFRRFTETHIQKGYELSEIKDALKESKLIFESAYDADTKGEVTDESERIVVIARENGK